jgi:hypothetical protein
MKSPRITPAEDLLIEQAMTPAVKALFDTAFSGSRTSRSSAYRLGVRAKLSHGTDQIAMECPYFEGTVEFDAFYAGVDEGRTILRTLV